MRIRTALGALAPLSWVLALIGVLAAAHLQNVRLLPVLTGSMAPSLAPGDAVITRDRPVDQVRVGQVLVVVPPGETAGFAHRVVAVAGDPARPVIRTKGDANPAPDDWTVQLDGQTVSEVQAHVPWVGAGLLAVQGPVGRALLLVGIGLLLLIAAVRVLLGSVVVLTTSP